MKTMTYDDILVYKAKLSEPKVIETVAEKVLTEYEKEIPLSFNLSYSDFALDEECEEEEA